MNNLLNGNQFRYGIHTETQHADLEIYFPTCLLQDVDIFIARISANIFVIISYILNHLTLISKSECFMN